MQAQHPRTYGGSNYRRAPRPYASAPPPSNQGNCIRVIGGLAGLAKLRLLDLSSNDITRLSGLDGLPSLEALMVRRQRGPPPLFAAL